MKKLELASVKYFPIVANVALLVLMLFQIYHVEVKPITGYLVGCSLWANINLIIQSKRLYFCTWHRVLLYNIMFYAVLQICWRLGFEFNYYLYLCLTINIASLITAFMLYRKNGCYTKKVSQRSKRFNN